MAHHIKSPCDTYPKRSLGQHNIFLAGSIEMNTATNWQQIVFDHFNQDTNINCIFNPRRDDWDSSWQQTLDDVNFVTQVEWELDHLTGSDIIFMYFDPNTKSPITLLEFGLYARSGKLVVCCPDGFWRKGNIEVTCRYYRIPLFHTLDEALSYVDQNA